MSDLISLSGIRVLAICGVLPEERTRRQPFSIDLVISTSFDRAAQSDDLADTIDYSAIAASVTNEATSTSYQLIEALSDHLARTVLSLDDAISQVVCSVTKVRPPMETDLASVTCTRTVVR